LGGIPDEPVHHPLDQAFLQLPGILESRHRVLQAMHALFEQVESAVPRRRLVAVGRRGFDHPVDRLQPQFLVKTT
jgi:hypothetical protein